MTQFEPALATISSKVIKRIGLFFLLASLAGVFLHMTRLPQEVVAAPEGPASLTFSGGPGETPADAVIIHGAHNYVAVVAGEYQYLARQFGRQGRDWRMTKKELYRKGDRVFDHFHLELPDGSKRQVYFDITEHFEKR